MQDQIDVIALSFINLFWI